ncbi:hypothetical protein FM109_05130 [Vibrio casei]|nr:hypothetical protein FM109_05130 [Vibrio casei]
MESQFIHESIPHRLVNIMFTMTSFYIFLITIIASEDKEHKIVT